MGDRDPLRQQRPAFCRLTNVGRVKDRHRVLLHGCVLAVTMFPVQALAVLQPVALHCASVAQNGQVTITWTPPADPLGEFAYYQIYSATAAAGPYLPAGTVAPLSTPSFIDPVADGRSGPVFYFITTVTNGLPPEESLPSDTVATIFLQVFQSIPPGSADLSWNHLGIPASAQDSFSVWMEYPVGTLQQLATVHGSVFSYQHIISICEDSLTFHIRRNGPGCSSISNWTGDVFRDVTPPSAPIVAAVTVDTSSTGSDLATISWFPSPEADTDGYIILFEAPGGTIIVDTVWGASSTSYEWFASLAGERPESYSVAAFDTCRTGAPPSPNTSAAQPFHTSLFLQHVYDECAGTVALSWTPYTGWPVQDHTLYTQVDGGPWNYTALIDAASSTAEVQVQPFRQYCYVVVAAQGPGLPNSISNRTCLTTDYPGLPEHNYLRTVTVSGEEEITIVDSVDVLASVVGYRLERSENGGVYEEIATQGPSLGSVITFVDTDVRPATTGYRYRVVVVDACGNDALTSNIGSNIVLTATPDLHGINTLAWNGYQQWDGQIQAHAIYRQVEDGPEVLLQVAPPTPWTTVDDVSGLTRTNGRFCYHVLALETSNPSGINMTSRSNTACAVQEELVYIPNAFIIGGNNPVFKPQLAYADVTQYELSIINRWGQVFWTTNDPEEAWDGTAGGRPVPMGVYAYYCNFKNGAGREYEKRGTVTMLTAED